VAPWRQLVVSGLFLKIQDINRTFCSNPFQDFLTMKMKFPEEEGWACK
jgi:hypothetical protein